MVFFALAFLAGVSLLQLQSQLPSVHWAWLLLLLPVLILKYSRLRILCFLLAGFLWAILPAAAYFEHRPDSVIYGQDILVSGVISSIPQQQEHNVRFEMKLDNFKLDGYQAAQPERIRLSWYYGAKSIRAGQRWQLLVRLKPPNGFHNPGGFDYEAWLYEQGIHATGYVKKNKSNILLSEAGWGSPLLRLRQQLYHFINAQPTNGSAAILNALAIGHRADMKADDWQSFIATGTNHLVAISGLHIGLVAGFAVSLMRLVAMVPGLGVLGRWRVLLVGSFIAAWLYAALANFTIPTQRALIMLAVVYGGMYFYRRITLLQSLALALFFVLLWSPISVLSAGFWFSFLAVAAIGYSLAGRMKGRSRVLLWVWPQLLVVVLLIPISLFLFQQTSLVAVLANMLAIPVVGLLVVPLLLGGIVMAPVSGWLSAHLIQLSGLLVQWLLNFLNVLSDSSWSLLYAPQPDFAAMVFAIGGLLFLFMPRGIPGRQLSIIFLLPLLVNRPVSSEAGSFEVNLLDVGQGLSVFVRTQQHQVLFDTGPRFSERFNAGEKVILPFLRHEAVRQLDMLIISNGDNDHIGGADSLLQQFEVGQVLGRDTETLQHANKQLCEQGMKWHWDGVEFEILHPRNQRYKKRNNYSCVLKVSNAAGSLLISGDIEARAERELIERYGQQLKAKVLIAPHHGSKSSSTNDFISQVMPSWVLYPAGYLNRYQFPRQEVVKRYQAQGARQLSSANNGHIRLIFQANGAISEAESYRQVYKRYWHRPVSAAL